MPDKMSDGRVGIVRSRVSWRTALVADSVSQTFSGVLVGVTVRVSKVIMLIGTDGSRRSCALADNTPLATNATDEIPNKSA